MVMKLHHSLTDGIGGMQLLLALFGARPEPTAQGEMPELRYEAAHGTAELVSAFAFTERRIPLGGRPCHLTFDPDHRRSACDLRPWPRQGTGAQPGGNKTMQRTIMMRARTTERPRRGWGRLIMHAQGNAVSTTGRG